MSTPSQIETKSLSIAIDHVKCEAAFEADNSKFIHVASIKQNGRAVPVVLKGSLSTNGINSTTFNKKVAYSMGMTFEDEADIIAIEAIADFIRSTFPGYTIDSPIKNDKFYVKLRVDKKKFDVVSNVKLDVKKCDEIDLIRGQGVKCFGEFQVWINVDSMKAGLSFKPAKLEFSPQEPEME